MPVLVDGELLPDKEIRDLMKMVDHDCKEFAGQFFDCDRSEKFRQSWNDIGQLRKKSPQDCFVEHSWKHFMVHVRAWYAEKLKDERIPEEEKSRLHRALCIQAMLSKSKDAESPVQLAPNTQQFVGDKIEKRHIGETYGSTSALRERMLGTAKRFH